MNALKLLAGNMSLFRRQHELPQAMQNLLETMPAPAERARYTKNVMAVLPYLAYQPSTVCILIGVITWDLTQLKE